MAHICTDMARPGKNTIEYFPKWEPTRITLLRIFDSVDKKIAFKSFRQSSSAFIKKIIVRNFILKKYNNECVICGSNNKLEIDHIKSVWFCFHNNLIYGCNIESNLQLLCNKCNTSKLP